MEIKFSSDLDFQKEAINSIVNLFRGQIDNSDAYFFRDNVIPNELNIADEQIFENLRKVQNLNSIKQIENIENFDGKNFTVEMETGTGKTYVYIRTILELNKLYGFKKFIIIVPSVAIKEGVLKTLDITKDHFKELYSCTYEPIEYNSSKLTEIKEFAQSNGLEIMVMTIDSFNKDTNVINRYNDRLSRIPIEFISSANPILILDEPQNMESEKRKKAIENLNPLFILRYSATHRNYYNLVYRLTPVEADAKGLVKHIEVFSVIEDHDYNNVYLKLENIQRDKRGYKAKLKIFKRTDNGPKPKSYIFRLGDDLFPKSDLFEYEDFRIEEINPIEEFVEFSNGIRIDLGQEQGLNREELMKEQIRCTINQHFKKYEKFKSQGIKVLSLFFIDKVANYKLNGEDGFILKTFKEEFDKLKQNYEDFKDLNVEEVEKSYFSPRGYTAKNFIEKDDEAYNIIMRDKEELLSFDKKVQFIFSHSALREGWDNPNVFNICTLNETVSDIKKRQEIGRGLRLPVNQNGDRITNQEFLLTVIANESYKNYAKELQKEYNDEYGVMAVPEILNPKNRTTLKLKSAKLDPESKELWKKFKELWKTISKKTKYSVCIDRDNLVKNCIEKINAIEDISIKLRIERALVSYQTDGQMRVDPTGSKEKRVDKDYIIPNLIDKISNDTNLTRETIIDILSQINNLDLIFSNPQGFILEATSIIRDEMKDFLVKGVEYTQLDDCWKMEFTDMEASKEKCIYVEKSIYNGIVYDSGYERNYAEEFENCSKIKLFIKLPRFFTVPTPIGKYNPDWGIIKDQWDLDGNIKKKLHLIWETKGDKNNLRKSEYRKIQCATKHFETIFKDIDETDPTLEAKFEVKDKNDIEDVCEDQ